MLRVLAEIVAWIAALLILAVFAAAWLALNLLGTLDAMIRPTRRNRP